MKEFQRKPGPITPCDIERQIAIYPLQAKGIQQLAATAADREKRSRIVRGVMNHKLEHEDRCRECMWFDPACDRCRLHGKVLADDPACESFQPAED